MSMSDILNQIKEEMGYSNAENAELMEQAEFYDNLSDNDFESMDDEEYAEYESFLQSLEHAQRHRKHAKHHGKHHRAHHHGAHHHGAHHHGRHHHKGNHAKGGLHQSAAASALGITGNPNPLINTSTQPPAYGSIDYYKQLMLAGPGDLNITVIRQTSNIASPLPYILFGLNGYQSSYKSTIQQYLPAGVTMAASIDIPTGDILLTYTSGANVDIVRLSLTGSQISYSEFLFNMNQNYFKTALVRQQYNNDVNLTLAISQPIQYGKLSALSAKSANSLFPRSKTLPTDFNVWIIMLGIKEVKVTADFSWVQNIINVGAGGTQQIIGWDVYFSDRKNLNDL